MKKAMTDRAHAALRERRDRLAFVDRCRNMFGHLEGDARTRLEAVLKNPNQRTWERAYSLIIGANGWTTLWQAWIKVDADAPLTKARDAPWPRVPDQLTLYRALKEVT